MKELVIAHLLAGPVPRVAGEPLLIGIRYELQPDWHIYWRNPGDSGIATWADLKAPEGWVAGPLEFPVPSTFSLPGGLENHGYSGSVTLLFPIQTAGPVAGSTLEIETGWLACTESLCVPGSTTLKLELDAKPPRKLRLEAERRLRAAAEAMPRPLPPEAERERSPTGLRIRLPGARELRFIPEPTVEESVGVEIEGSELRIQLGPEAPIRLGLLLGRTGAGIPFCYTIEG